MKYYRYMSLQSARKALESGEFIVQLPSKFDDPFECRAVMNCVSANSMAWIPDALDPYYRILCLCNAREHNDMLFWSSVYSDYGKGVRIGLELDGSIGEGVKLCDVIYRAEVPARSFDVGLSLQQLKIVAEDLMGEAMKCKSQYWHWQNESRLIVEYTSPLCIKRPCDSLEWRKKGVTETCTINLRKFITDVSLGAMVDWANAEEFVAELKKGYPSVKMYSVELDHRSYRYNYDSVGC